MSGVEEWNSACLSSFSRGDRPLVQLYVEPAGFSGRCTGMSVCLHVLPSSTGLPSKRCPCIGFLLRAHWEIVVFQHVAPPTRLRLEFPRETGLILRCAGKVGYPFQTKQGINPPVAIQMAEGAQMKSCREPRCSPRVRPVRWKTFWVASWVPSTISHFKTERGTSLETL